MDAKKAAAAIRATEMVTNQPMGSGTARMIAKHLADGNVQCAMDHYDYDGDKLRQYPDLNRVVAYHLGCRIHHMVGCSSWMCKNV